MNTEIEQLQNAHTHTQARIADYRRKLTELAHRLLKVRKQMIIERESFYHMFVIVRLWLCKRFVEKAAAPSKCMKKN